ncbi:MAG: hypothetical protein KJZ92_14530 [Rhodocyclaceae bacterium]|nr:hypothetical protein [Rhodocyclaceae bacterium]
MQQVGILALQAGELLPLQVMHSAAGFYIGTQHPAEGPFSRESAEYWRDETEAATALEQGDWTQRPNP